MHIKQLFLLSALGTLTLSGCQPSSGTLKTETKEIVSEDINTADIVSTTPIVLPGAPGQAARTLSAEEAIDIADNSYSPDDVIFMQNMIPHHAQAVELADLVDTRSNLKELVDLAGRIGVTQADEIKFMEDWLKERGEPLLPESADPSSAHDGHNGFHDMEGMASPKDMARLATLKGVEFDKLWLSLMITHHEGALTMVENLTDQPGSAYDPVLFEFTNDIVSDQTDEIERMSAVLGSLSADDRAGLTAGYKNA